MVKSLRKDFIFKCTYLWLIIININLISNCSDFCLICGDNNNCELCDLWNTYYLNEEKHCVKSVLENCPVINSNGQCL